MRIWELVFIIGAALIVAGAALVYAPAAWIVAGLILCWVGYRAAPAPSPPEPDGGG